MSFSFLSGAIQSSNTGFNVPGYTLPSEVEKALGNPTSNGQVLASNTNGSRYWTSNISFAYTANNTTYVNNKTEGNLNVNSAVYSTNASFAYTANNTTYLNGNPDTYFTNATNISTGTLDQTRLPQTGVVAGTYGNASSIPVITVDLYGRINTVSTSAVAGVTSYSFNNANNTFLITTGDGSVFAANLNNIVNLFVSNSVQFGTDATINSIFYTGTSNNTSHVSGKSVGDLSVNSATFSTNAQFAYTANNTTYLNGNPDTYFTNATNISTGTLGEPRLPYRMNQDVTNTSDVQFKNLNLTGNLFVGGSVTTITANNLSITDNMFYLNNGINASITNISGNGSVVTFTANNNFVTGWDVVVTDVNPSSYNGVYNNIRFSNSTHFQVDSINTDAYISGGTARGKSDLNPDVGFAAGYNDGTYHHTGFFRDHTNGTWKVFDNYIPEPDNSIYINQTDPSFHLANLMANTIFVGNNTVYSTIDSTSFSGTSNNSNYLGGKLESQLNVSRAASAASADDAINSSKLNNKTEGNLNVNSAVYSTNAAFAYTANSSSYSNNANYLNNKVEGNLNVNSATFSTNASFAYTANSSTYANVANYLNNKIETNLNVNSAVYSTNASFAYTANNATYFGGQLPSYYLSSNTAGNLNVNSAITSNNAQYLNNKDEGNLNVNSAVYSTNASFAYTANNTTYLNGKLDTYFTNATNINTGTLPYSIIPANVVNTTSSFTYSSNIVIGSTGAIVFNAGAKLYDSTGSQGTTGQILASNGSGNLYWTSLALLANNDVFINTTASYTFTNTAVHTHNANIVFNANAYLVINYGSGIIDSNNSIGTTGQILVSNGTNGVYWTAFSGGLLAGNGLGSNTTHYFAVGNSGIVSNSSGLFVNTGLVATLTDSQQLTNKRVVPRVNTQVTATSLTPDVSQYNTYVLTGLASTLQIANPSPTPSSAEKLIFRIKDNGTRQTLTFPSSGTGQFRNVGVTVPAQTPGTGATAKTLYIGCIYNVEEGFWDVVAVANN